jgi:histidinol-phosphate aminotransferase
VFAKLYHVPFAEIPLRAAFTIDVDAYCASEANIVIANPNAPTGIALPLSDVERIVASNPRRVVIVDEAYVDFGAESAVSLVDRYPNLLVTGTFSKSRSLAGGRLGFGIACPALIADLKTIQYSTNPYIVNRMTMAAGVAALEDDAYYMDNCQMIIATRAKTAAALASLGFFVLSSAANFLCVRSDAIAGADYYAALRERGILVRHFTLDRIADYNRITIGTEEEMEALVAATEAILKEKQP